MQIVVRRKCLRRRRRRRRNLAVPSHRWVSLISIWYICIVIRKLANSMHTKAKGDGRALSLAVSPLNHPRR